MIWILATFLLQGRDEIRVSSHAYAPPPPTLKVDTKLVEISAIVRDSHGKPVAGLTKEDFRILDEKEARVVDVFSVETKPLETANGRVVSTPATPTSAVPIAPARQRYLALFIDDVNAQDGAHLGDLKRTKTAAEKFVRDALKSDVRIGIFSASGKPNLDFTGDEVKLIETIEALKSHTGIREEGLSPYCPWIPPYLAYRIAYERDRSAVAVVMQDAAWKAGIYRACIAPTRDQVMLQAEETWRQVKALTTDTLNTIGRVVDHLGTMPGKRELLIASSGFIGVSMQAEKDKIINRALRADVTISALDSKGLFVDAPADPMRKVETEFKATEMGAWVLTVNEPMANLAEKTGGLVYANNNDLAEGFHKLGGEPEVTYRLGFKPEGVVADGAYHKLKVVVKGRSVQSRPGYFAPLEKAPESLQAKIDREIQTQDTIADFPVGLAIQQEKNVFWVIVSVDISKISFLKKDDRQTQRIVFTTALIDDHGKITAAKEGWMDLALKDSTFKRLSVSGVNARISFIVPPGKYKLRQVAEEAVAGKIACSTYPVEIK